MADLVVLGDHPFFLFAKPSVWQMCPGGRWTVRWRDFHTVKQDMDFTTREEAEAFARRVNRPPLVVYDDACDLAEADRYWRKLEPRPPHIDIPSEHSYKPYPGAYGAISPASR